MQMHILWKVSNANENTFWVTPSNANTNANTSDFAQMQMQTVLKSI